MEHLTKAAQEHLEATKIAGQLNAAKGQGLIDRSAVYDVGAGCADAVATNTSALGAEVQQGQHARSLRRRLMQSQHESINVDRGLSILEHHPEFEEFLWLLRSGLV